MYEIKLKNETYYLDTIPININDLLKLTFNGA